MNTLNKIKFIFTLLLLIPASYSFAQEDGNFKYDPNTSSIIPKYLGKVTLLKGKAYTQDKGKNKKYLKVSDKIFPGQTLKTEKASFVKVEMVDTTVVTLGKSSELNFEKFIYRTKEDREMSIKLLQGKMRSHFRVKSKKADALKVKVRHISMGIRGTKILANATTLQDGRDYASIAILEGRVKAYDELYDEMIALGEGSEYYSITGKREYKKKKERINRKMTPQELRFYKALDKNSKKYFKPFLKYAKGYIVRNESAPQAPTNGSNQETTPSPTQKKIDKEKMDGNSWEKTLNKLNRRLDENNSGK